MEEKWFLGVVEPPGNKGLLGLTSGGGRTCFSGEVVALLLPILYAGVDEEVAGEWVFERGDVLGTYDDEDGEGSMSARPVLLRLPALFSIPRSGCLSIMAGSGSLKELDSCCSFRILFRYSEFCWIRSSRIVDGVWMLGCD